MIELHHLVIWVSGNVLGLVEGMAIAAVLYRGAIDPFLIRPLATLRCLWRERRNGRR